MRFNNVQYIEKEQITVAVHNLNAAKAFLDGQVVFAISYDELVVNAALTTPTSGLQSLGVDAQSATDAATNITNSFGLILGIVKVNPTTNNTNASGQASIPIGGVGEAVCYGFTDAIVQIRTRATSTDVWTATTLNAGDQLIPETVNNNLKWQGTLALTASKVPFVLGQSTAAASFASGANTNVTITGTAGTVETARFKVRVCCM